MAKQPKKPTKKLKTYYDYNECCDYLQKKYKYNERDYSGRWKDKSKSPDDTKPEQSFWRWLIDHFDIHDGCFIVFSKEELDDPDLDAEDWVREIYKRYLDEFADENGELEMYVWW